MEITVHTDGACRGNPGKASVAFTITGIGEKPIEYAQPIGVTTNNQAEYQAMHAAVNELAEHQLHNNDIQFFSDSELMIRQLTGVYKVKDGLLRPIFSEIMAGLEKLRADGNEISLTAVRREENQRADELANMALDGSV